MYSSRGAWRAGGPVRETDAGTKHATAWSAAERANAFRRLAEGHIEDAYRLAGFILGTPPDARDAVHDAFITAWRSWPSLRDPSKFDSWFKRIVVNTCRDRLRRASRQRTSELDPRTATSVPDVEGAIVDRMIIEQALATLKPDDRIVLALRYYQDLRLAEIAEVLEIPAGTVKSRLNHAHSRLRGACAVVDHHHVLGMDTVHHSTLEARWRVSPSPPTRYVHG